MSKHQIQPEYGHEQADAGQDGLSPSRQIKFSGAYGDRGILFFPVQLTTSRIGSLTRLIHALLYVITIYTYRSGRSNPFCETKFSGGANKHR